MPELAEVEFYRNQWNKALGRELCRIHLQGGKRVFRDQQTTAAIKSLKGSVLRRSYASGKQLLFEFEPACWLGIHLGMTGELSRKSPAHRPEKHDHLILYTREQAFVFSDPRQFGRIRCHRQPQEPDWWTRRATDILSPSFTLAHLLARTAASRRPVKALLLDQALFPGVGNWMADEILWRARILPHRPWSGLTEAEQREVWKRARQVCRDALRVIAPDWATPPDTWLFNHRWRDGGTCPKTGKPLVRQQIAGRTTCYSPAWQR